MKQIALFVAGAWLLMTITTQALVHEIQISDFSFEPAEITVYPEDTVRWILVSGTHTVTSDPSSTKSWDSGTLDIPGQTFETTFTWEDGPGPFSYYCAFHPSVMTGIVKTADTCFASFDPDGNGIALTVADLVYLMRSFVGEVPSPRPLYTVDINGDCVIDGGDLELLGLIFTYGIGIVPWYPVPTCCYPDTVRGACCLGADSCSLRSFENCEAIGGTYQGNGTDCEGDFPCDCCVGNRGDFNGDGGEMNISDLTFFVAFLFAGGSEPPCFEAADINGDGELNIADLTDIVNTLFFSINPLYPCP